MASIRKNELVDTYPAIDDKGITHTISVWAIVVYTDVDNRTVRNVGTKSHKMQNGNHVEVHTDGTLEELATGKVMRRV